MADPGDVTFPQARAGSMTSVEALVAHAMNEVRTLLEVRISAVEHAADIRARTQIDLQALVSTPATEHLLVIHNKDVESALAVSTEKFGSIARQFIERDIRSEQSAIAGGQALAAALQAAKELVGAQGEASSAAAVKSETSFTKQIDQIGVIIATLEKALDARITEMKERVDRGESALSATSKQRTETRLDVGTIVSMVVIVLMGLAIVTTVLLARGGK